MFVQTEYYAKMMKRKREGKSVPKHLTDEYIKAKNNRSAKYRKEWREKRIASDPNYIHQMRIRREASAEARATNSTIVEVLCKWKAEEWAFLPKELINLDNPS